MEAIANAVIIAGPTTTGKSEISEMLARKINGAIINSDNYYFYMDDNFHIGLGLSKDEPPKDIPYYLFGIRELTQPKPNPDEFYHLVIQSVKDALGKGLTPIIQGCSFTLNHKLITSGITNHVYIPIWSNKDYLLERCHSRVRQMLNEGLLVEAQKIIDKGFDKTWIATEGIIYRPTIDFLKSRGTDESILIDEIVKGIVSKAEEQEVKYHKINNAIWIKHQNNPGEASDKIIENLELNS